MPNVDNIKPPENSAAFTANSYGNLRSFFMAPPLRWSNEKFKKVFGSNAQGSKHDNAEKVREIYETL